MTASFMVASVLSIHQPEAVTALTGSAANVVVPSESAAAGLDVDGTILTAAAGCTAGAGSTAGTPPAVKTGAAPAAG